MQLLERLAALVPRPRVHLTRFHGVLAPNYKYRKQIVPAAKVDPEPAATDDEMGSKTTEPKRIPWARLLKRVFGIDISVCSRCKGKVRVIAAIEDPKIIKKILEHMGLPSTPPRLEMARGPPVSDQGDMFAQEFFET